MAASDIIRTWFGGTWHEGDRPVMKAADHGLWLGTTVFDGARAFEGVVPDLEAHCERVNRSAEAMGLNPTHTVGEMMALTMEGLGTLEPGAPVYIRPMYWSTGSESFSVVSGDPDSAVFCLCLEQMPMPGPEDGATLTRTSFSRPTLATAMTNAKAACLYPNNGRMLREAKSKGFTNALVTDQLGNVAETATSNVFMVRDGLVMTPVPNGSFLNGITRQRIIGLLRADGHEVQEATLGFADFEAADEVFMTGNLSKVTPVLAFDERQYQRGPMTKRARELYWDWALSGR